MTPVSVVVDVEVGSVVPDVSVVVVEDVVAVVAVVAVVVVVVVDDCSSPTSPPHATSTTRNCQYPTTFTASITGPTLTSQSRSDLESSRADTRDLT